MFNFICHRSLLPHFRAHITTCSSPIHKLPSLSFSSSSSLASPNSPSNSSDEHSFTVKYLINSCRFPPEKALPASKYLHLKTQENPDSVLAFFKNHGFTNTQISDVVRISPLILSFDPENTLLPKLKFLSSIGLTNSEIASAITAAPNILKFSLKNRIIPSYNLVHDLLQSNERTISMIIQNPKFLSYYLQGHVVKNVEILRDVGVPESNILYFIMCHGIALRVPTDRCIKIVEEAKKLGFNPLSKFFMLAFYVLQSMSVSTWKKKEELYKKWGWSQDDIFVAFGKNPRFMTVSEEKITRVMDFLINKMGVKSSVLVQRPVLISLSLEKRTVPRCLFYQDLLDRGLVEKKSDFNISKWLDCTEKDFISRIRKNYKAEAPELLKLYQAKLNLEN